MKSFLSLNEPAMTAVFCANDELAIGAIKAAKEYNLRIPGDIAIAGFDNVYLGTLIDPSLTTVDVPAYEIGKTAIKNTLRLLQKKEDFTFDSIKIKTRTVVRKSTEIGKNVAWNLYFGS